MKVNLKKIGAIVAGATILASSVAFAGLMYGNTVLVDDTNGAPQVKVVVGEKAAASDGVVAANIAAKIASEAYKTQTLTAEVVGEGTCTAGEEGTSECTVTDEKVTLEIKVPGGAVAGQYTFGTLLGDYIDRNLLDRQEEKTTYDFGTSDISDTANPFTDGDGDFLSDSLGKEALYRISGTMFDPMETVTVKDDDANKQYTEKQDVWIDGGSYVWYDESEDSEVAKMDGIAYTIKFSGTSDDFGIPVCTTPEETSKYETCDDTYRTTTHKVMIKFLGEDWVISEMEAPNESPENEQKLVQGGHIKLAKETVSGIINKGEYLEVDGYKFILDDIVETTHEAALSVQDAAGNIVTKAKIAEDYTQDVNVGGGKTYRVHVYKTVPGFRWEATWADMAVFSKELNLESGQDLDPEVGNNQGYKVVLGWKDKGAVGNTTTADHLRTIIIQSDDIDEISNTGEDELGVGDYLNIVQDPVTWKLTFNGLDLTSAERDTLKFSLETGSAKKVDVYNHTSTYVENCEIKAPYVKVTSAKDSAFMIEEGVGGKEATYKEFYVAVSGVENCENLDGLNNGTVFMKESTSSTAKYVALNYTGQLNISYDLAGDGDDTWAKGGVIAIVNNTDAPNSDLNGSVDWGASGLNFDFLFGISEKAGVGSSDDYADKMIFGYDKDDESFNFDDGDNLKKDEITYVAAGPAGYTDGTYEEGFITERGSIFDTLADKSAEFKIAKRLGKAQFTLASVKTEELPAGWTAQTLGEGDEYTTSNDVTIRVKEITQTATCVAGTAAAPTCDMTGVSAVIMPDNVESLDAAIPYDYSKFAPLVVLDKDAVGYESVITVGGPAVNTVTKEVLEGADFAAMAVDNKVVKEVVAGKKIVVAGIEAEDTVAAGADFIAALKKQ